jgi:HlyD family secretion protein
MKRVLAAVLVMALGCEEADPASASGTIEFTQSDVAGTIPARVERILVEEGATVRAGDTLAILRQTGLPEDLDQRRARVAGAEAELADLLRGPRQAELERARAEVASARSEAERTAADTARLSRLLAAGGISQSAVDAAVSAARVAGARRDGALESLALLEAGARPDRVAAARANVATAKAQLAMGRAAQDELVLTAPVDGQVLARHAEPGEVLGAGVPVLSLGDARNAWVRVYLAAPVFAAIRVGDSVPVTIDGLQGRTFMARVGALATTAEFTPRVALTEKERADLLFGVKLELSDTTGVLKAGLPATASFHEAAAARGRDGAPGTQ